MKRKIAAAAVTMLVAALGAGCGGGDGDDASSKATTTTAPTEPLTKTEYVSRANAICRATTAELAAAGTRFRAAETKTTTLPPKSEIEKFLTGTSIPAYERMLDKLRALTPPPSDKRPVLSYIAALAGAIDMAKANPGRYADAEADDPFDGANAMATAFGMKDCG